MNRRSIFLALAIALGMSGCVASGSGSLRVTGTTGVVYTEPPQPQVETVTVRPGHLWIKGRWDWQNNQWTWVGGHWERERSGYAWQEGHWERRGNAWHWVEGRWMQGSVTVDGDAGGGVVVRDHRDHGGGPEVRDHRDGGGGVVVRDHRDGGGGAVVVRDHRDGGGGTVTVVLDVNGEYPNQAPPALQTESPGAARSGFIWVTGRWNWKRGQGWEWMPGHWERARANKTWEPGKWEMRGKTWFYVEGGWR